MAGPGLTIARLAADESGAAAIEYGLLATLIALVLIVAFMSLGGTVTDLYNYVMGTAGGAMSTAG